MRLSFSHISIFECRKKSHLTNHQQSSFEVKPFRSDVFNIHKTPRRKRKGFALGLDQKRRKKNSVEDFDTAPLSRSPLYLLVERSEGATIQLTTCGARPKPCESQRWCVSTTELHARARGASLCGSNTEAACHRVPSLWHNALSLPYRVHVFMCLHHMCTLACIYVYRVITFHLFGNVFYKSMCTYRCVFVLGSLERAWHACVLQSACQKLPGWLTGLGLIFCYRSYVQITWWLTSSV